MAPSIPTTATQFIAVDGISLFYRSAGPKDGPVLFLLHGMPSSSFQFRDLITRLAVKYRVIAPDWPASGFTVISDERKYEYTAASIVKTMENFVDLLGIKSYALYLHDYGAPIALRMALNRPKMVKALICQNGNIYEEGWESYWDTWKLYWEDTTNVELRSQILTNLNREETAKFMLLGDSPDPDKVAPETYTLDWALLSRPGHAELIIDLILDHRHNVALYPAMQKYLRESGVPLIVLWGKRDWLFKPETTALYKRDSPNAEIKVFDGGHFLLESHLEEVSDNIRAFLDKHL